MNIEKNLCIEIIEKEEDVKKFWQLHDEYMLRDIFPNSSLGRPLTEDEKKWFFSDEYRSVLTALTKRNIDRFHFVFFKREDTIVGFSDYGTYLSEDGKCFIVEYCILPKFRNRGLGSEFFKLIKQSETEKRAKYFALNVSNDRNRHFWEKQGFRFDGYDKYGVMLMKMQNHRTRKPMKNHMDKSSYAWNPKQKQLTTLLKDKNTFSEGISLCLEMHTQVHDLKKEAQKTLYQLLLTDLNEQLVKFRPEQQFSSIAWNIWHITRIEDAIANILIADTDQVFNKAWQESIGVERTDTGNAMKWSDVDSFDTMMNVEALYRYRMAVGERTQKILPQIGVEARSKKPGDEQLTRLLNEGVLVNDPESLWLLDYWKGKTIVGLLLMPITRHQIVHINDCFKIKQRYSKYYQGET